MAAVEQSGLFAFDAGKENQPLEIREGEDSRTLVALVPKPGPRTPRTRRVLGSAQRAAEGTSVRVVTPSKLRKRPDGRWEDISTGTPLSPYRDKVNGVRVLTTSRSGLVPKRLFRDEEPCKTKEVSSTSIGQFTRNAIGFRISDEVQVSYHFTPQSWQELQMGNGKPRKDPRTAVGCSARDYVRKYSKEIDDHVFRGEITRAGGRAKWHLAHLFPVAAGGEDDRRNIVIISAACNQSRMRPMEQALCVMLRSGEYRVISLHIRVNFLTAWDGAPLYIAKRLQYEISVDGTKVWQQDFSGLSHKCFRAGDGQWQFFRGWAMQRWQEQQRNQLELATCHIEKPIVSKEKQVLYKLAALLVCSLARDVLITQVISDVVAELVKVIKPQSVVSVANLWHQRSPWLESSMAVKCSPSLPGF